MRVSVLLLTCSLALAAPAAMADDTPAPPAAPSQQTLNEIRSACQSDAEKLCPAVQPGGGRILACLKEHQDAVSDGCKQAILKAKRNPS